MIYTFGYICWSISYIFIEPWSILVFVQYKIYNDRPRLFEISYQKKRKEKKLFAFQRNVRFKIRKGRNEERIDEWINNRRFYRTTLWVLSILDKFLRILWKVKWSVMLEHFVDKQYAITVISEWKCRRYGGATVRWRQGLEEVGDGEDKRQGFTQCRLEAISDLAED